MGYQLGIDLGTTFTGAAVHRDGRVEVSSLGSRTTAIPSVVLLRDDETVLTGEAAVRRALSEPGRVAREFKRRLGDTTPIIVGGSPYSAEALMARLLRSVVDEVEAREGGPAETIAVSHPANWGAYKTDLLHQAVLLADLDPDRVVFTTEPVAAATFYAHQERVEPGEIVAVYDLGGGTFDAAVLRAGAQGFEILGRPEGIERLGGIDFDAAVFSHVVASIGGLFDQLDPDDPATQNAVARLRQECVDAKEALSSDTDAVVPVLLPNLQTEVRITRAEFEGLIRPSLADSIASMRRALRSAGIEADDVAKVLLVGGSSRIPLIAQLVSAELGRPVAVDTHPKHAISMGAAYVAAGHSGVADVGDTAQLAPATALVEPEPTEQVAAAPTEPVPIAPTEPAAAALAAPTAPMPVASGGADEQGGTKRTTMLVGGAVAVAVVVALVVVVLTSGGGDDDTEEVAAADTTLVAEPDDADPADDPVDEAPEDEVVDDEAPDEEPGRAPSEIAADVNIAIAGLGLGPSRADVEVMVADNGAVELNGVVDDDTIRTEVFDAAAGVDGVPGVSDRLGVRPPDEQCTDEVRDRERWVCLIDATFDGEVVRATYESDFSGGEPRVEGGFHYHAFGDQIPVDDGGVPGIGPWLVWDQPEIEVPPSRLFANEPVPDRLCMRIATANHEIDGASGNCRLIEVIDG